MNSNHRKWGIKVKVICMSFLSLFSTYFVYGSQIFQNDMKAETDSAPFIDIANGNAGDSR